MSSTRRRPPSKNEQLAQLVTELQASMEDLRLKLDAALDNLSSERTARETAERERDQARRFLLDHGRHLRSCTVWGADDCDCGLREALGEKAVGE